MERADPFSLPGWQALSRECKLVRQLIGSGVTALGRANYADKKGEYYVAFFGLSVGIERLTKLILVSNYAIDNNGRMPDQRVVAKFGHKICDLCDAVERIANGRNLSLEHGRPSDVIANAALASLDIFADARRGRYANFDALSTPNLEGEFEPIQSWWRTVAEPILDRHFYGTVAEAGVVRRAKIVDQLLGGISVVHHTSETGENLDSIERSSYQTGITPYVQKFGRYYTLINIRWLCEVFYNLTDVAVYRKQIDVFFGHYEHFNTYRVEDEFLKTRKVWPLQ